MIASILNMRQHYQPGVMAYSPSTGEEYSANPCDYWDAKDSMIMRDAYGEPMLLVTRRECFEPVEA